MKEAQLPYFLNLIYLKYYRLHNITLIITLVPELVTQNKNILPYLTSLDTSNDQLNNIFKLS